MAVSLSLVTEASSASCQMITPSRRIAAASFTEMLYLAAMFLRKSSISDIVNENY